MWHFFVSVGTRYGVEKTSWSFYGTRKKSARSEARYDIQITFITWKNISSGENIGMEIDLKKENSRNVFLLMAASIVCSALIQLGIASMTSLINLFVIGGGSVMFSAVALMITNILLQAVKHKLVFTRLKNELPACRIDLLCQEDSRVEFSDVKNKWPEIFTDNIAPNIRNI